MRRCNQLSLDEAALMQALRTRGQRVLDAEAHRLVGIMRQEARDTTQGGAPGKPDWREEIARNIGIVARGITADGLSVDVGYSPGDDADGARAMVVGYGSGDRAAGGGQPITAGPPGRSVWDADLAGKHPSRARSVYPLPGAFNQEGNRFVADALRRLRTQFAGRVQLSFALLPGVVFHGKVRVRKR